MQNSNSRILLKYSLLLILSFLANVGLSQPQTVTFNYTGGTQSWTVPPCVTSISISVEGAQGGGPNGGQGSVVSGTINVTPGQVITIIVGGQPAGAAGGYGGGGNGQSANTAANGSWGGGGASSIIVGGVPVVVAGGGGGTGGGTTDAAGGAGGTNGSNGSSPFGTGGFGGTQSNGGAGGPPWIAAGNAGNAGSAGMGGSGATDPCNNNSPGGGGGGGYYGGGGGGSDCFGSAPYGGGGGGGGSSLVPAGGSATTGGNTGNGTVSITFSGIIATASNTGPYCEGDLVQLNGGGGATYNWSGPGGFTSTLQNPTFTATSATLSGTYMVIVTDPACPVGDTAYTTVVINEMPSVNPVADQTICNGDNTAAVNFSGVFAGATYTWTNNNTATGLAASGTGNIASFVGTAPTTTQVSQIIVTPSTPFCTGVADTFLITVLAKPTLYLSNDTTICENGTANLLATATGGGGAPYTYYWDFTGSTAGNQSVSPMVQTTYTVYVESATGCQSDPQSVTVSMFPPLSGNISPWETICPGYPTDISASVNGGIGQPYTFVWTTGDTYTGVGNHMINVNPPVTTNYSVVISDGCETTPLVLTTNVRVAPLPVPMVNVLNPIQCEPAVFDIVNVTDPQLSQFNYWVVNNEDIYINQDTIITNPLYAGSYDVQLVITSYEGCIDSVTFTDLLTVDPKPVADFRYSPNPVLMFNTQVHFDNYSFNGYTYQWYFESGSPAQSNLTSPDVLFPDGVTGRYDVMLITTSELNCVDTMIQELIVYPEVIIYAPNAFTPDGDEHNQTWQVYMEGIDIYDFELLVFNRWGEIVWESHDISVGWDGTYHGELIQSGAYTWIVRTKDLLNDGKYTFNGHVNIFR